MTEESLPESATVYGYSVRAVEFTNDKLAAERLTPRRFVFGGLGDLFRAAGEHIDKEYGVGDCVLLGANFDEDGSGSTLTLFFEDR